MPYDTQLADRVRRYLQTKPGLLIEEKTMFRGLAFMVNGKMCVNISGDKLMCRFDPALEENLAEQPGYEPMIMKGKVLPGYCYVAPEVLRTAKALAYWIDLCLAFNPEAKASKKKKG